MKLKKVLEKIERPWVIVLGEKTHGGGKSLISKKISESLENLGFSTCIISAGSEFRKIAVERGMSIEDFISKLTSDIELSRKIDLEIDKRILKEIIKKYRNKECDFIIVDSLLAPYYIKKLPVKSISILLVTDPEVVAKRVFERHREGDKRYKSVEEAKEELIRRTREDAERFNRLSQITDDPILKEAYKNASEHFGNEKFFDMVLDNNRYYTEVIEDFKKKLLEFFSSKF